MITLVTGCDQKARVRILVQVMIYRRLLIGPSRPIRSLRYIVACTRIRPTGGHYVTATLERTVVPIE